VQDLYAASKDNQAFLHSRLGLGHDQLKPYKEAISRWICPDPMRNQPISISKSKKAIADYKKAIERPEGLAELSIFYCEDRRPRETENMHLLRLALDLLCRHFRLQSRG
jgi:hypothetical protein